MKRQTTGVPGLDEQLGGGLIPGTLTVVVGATGIGKTQFGVHFAHAGIAADNHSGVFFDMGARGDSQSHARYAQRMKNWTLTPSPLLDNLDVQQIMDRQSVLGDYLHVFDDAGKRVTRQDLDWNQWHDWQAHLNSRLISAIGFLYGNFLQGSRRVVVDGVEPVGRPSDSIQLNLFEYIYHQVLRKDPAWVARDLLRQKYRENAQRVADLNYDHTQIGCLLLYTAQDTMLDDMITRPLDEGDALANANTLIYMGKVKNEGQLQRALYIAKHRGSRCSDKIIPFSIDDTGIVLDVPS
jgi:KaiC/GvpD/RAD55 family RecA-like ATPase